MANVKTPVSIEMSVDREIFRQKAEKDPVGAAEALNPEIKAFEHWLMRRGMDPLTRVESQIVREYLGYKLVV